MIQSPWQYFLGPSPSINQPFALIVRMASKQNLVFSNIHKTLIRVPTYQEFASNRDKYPEFEETINWETGELEVTPKKEAAENPDKQVMSGMAQQGFFLPSSPKCTVLFKQCVQLHLWCDSHLLEKLRTGYGVIHF